MTRRLLRNPAVLVLATMVVLGILALNWAIDANLSFQGTTFQVTGADGALLEEQLWQMRIASISQHVPGWATLTAVVALLGIFVVGSASRRGQHRSDSPATADAEPDAGAHVV